jgi:Tol biopolymer transport system component
MTTDVISAKREEIRTQVKDYPVASARFDWLAVALSAWVIGGMYLDGWAHNHGRVDDVFITPWHAVLYSGVLGLCLFLMVYQQRNMSKGHVWQRALPKGYGLSLIGVGLFLIGGGLDFLWHTLFGIEVNIETLLSPTHLLLAASGVLMISGPIRAAWGQRMPEETRGWKVLGPPILSAVLVLSMLTFFTQFAHPINELYAQKTTTINQGNVADIYVMNADGTAQTRLTSSPEMWTWSSDWSPDGRQIVVSRGQATPETVDNPDNALFIMNADGSGLRQLTNMPGGEWYPAWSPDGGHIAFVSKTPQSQQIFTINTDGSGLQQLTKGPAPAYGPDWSPDGTRIVYNSNASGSDQLYIMKADGSHPAPITSRGNDNWGAAWSPDGKLIAFNSLRNGNSDIYVIHPDGSGEQQLTDDPAREFVPGWSPDGQHIVFLAQQETLFDIYVMNADGSNVHNLSNNHALEYFQPRWSPDGRQILVTASGHTSLPIPYQTQSLGIASILLQSALLMGAALMLVKQWTMPLGGMTIMLAGTSTLMSIFRDQYVLLPGVLLAGLIADVLLWQLRPSQARRGQFYLFAFVVPVVVYSLYFLTLQLSQGLTWTVHLWLGSTFMAGVVGLFISFLLVSPLNSQAASNDLVQAKP